MAAQIRRSLSAIIVGAALVLGATGVSQRETARAAGEPQTTYLFVQTAQRGAFVPMSDAPPNHYRVTLEGVSPVTVVCTDSPERRVGAQSSCTGILEKRSGF